MSGKFVLTANRNEVLTTLIDGETNYGNALDGTTTQD